MELENKSQILISKFCKSLFRFIPNIFVFVQHRTNIRFIKRANDLKQGTLSRPDFPCIAIISPMFTSMSTPFSTFRSPKLLCIFFTCNINSFFFYSWNNNTNFSVCSYNSPMNNMKILQLCKKFPWPLKDGESVAVNAIGIGLADLGVTVDLLAMNTKKHFTTVDSEVIESLPHYRMVKWVPIDTKVKVFQALTSLIEGSSYHLKRFIDLEFEQTLKEVLYDSGEHYDFVILESLYMVPYIEVIKKYSKAKIIFRSHNLEYEIWERLAQNNRNPLLKWYLGKLARKLKEFECSRLQKINHLIPISPVDYQKYLQLGYKGDIYALPLGIDLRKYPLHFSKVHSKIEVGFIGSLDWRPNVEGLKWFLTKVWPAVQARYPNVFRIHIAGRNMPSTIRNHASADVIIHGEVEDAVEFMKHYGYFIVPLFSGSGMRVKILEAMAMGKIVLSTQIGIEGIPATPEKEYIKADTFQEFMGAFGRIMNNEYDTEILGRNARSFIDDNYSMRHLSSGFCDYLHDILEKTLQKAE